MKWLTFSIIPMKYIKKPNILSVITVHDCPLNFPEIMN